MTVRSFLALAAAALLAACGGTDTPATPATASIRVVHASPDAPAVDVYVKGSATPAFSNLAYGSATNYADVPAGTAQFEVRPAGAAASSAAVYTSPSLTLAASAKITAVAAGLVGSTAAADQFRLLPLVEGFSAVASGKARVRIVHAAPDAPAVDLSVGDTGTATISGLARFADTGAAGAELPAGAAAQLGVAAAGGARVTGFTLPSLPSAELFVIAVGKLGNTPRDAKGFGLLAVGPTGALPLIKQNPVVYALHASPDTPPVQVYAGSAKVLDTFSFGQLKSAQVPPGAYALGVFPASANGTGTAAITVNANVVAGERYLVIATGFLSPPSGNTNTLRALVQQEAFPIDATKQALAVVHASPDAPAVDVGTYAGSTLTPIAGLTNLAFGAAIPSANALQLAAGTLPIGVGVAGSNTAAKKFSVPATAGSRAWVVAAGALSPASGSIAPFGLIVVDTAASPWAVAGLTAQ